MLPPSWESVTLGEFVENEKGKKPKKQAIEKNAECNLPYIDIEAFEEGKIKSWTNGEGCRICYESDFLMVWDGSRSGLVGKGMYGALGSTLVRINFPNMNNQYAYYFLLSKYQEINTRAKGSGTPHVDPALLWNYQFPIAPFNEQKRIVAKIEELFSELNNGIAALKTAREQLKVYRQSVLKHAFEGKLTAKWREDNADKLESPEQLLARIQQEREARYQEQLEDWETAVKEWEINGKKGKKPSKPRKQKIKPIGKSDLDDLFDIPEKWKWVFLNELSEYIVDGTHHTPDYTDSGVPFISAKDIRDFKINFEKARFISDLQHKDLIKRCRPRKNSVLLTKSGTIGRVALVDIDFEFSLFESVSNIPILGNLQGRFVMWAVYFQVSTYFGAKNQKGVAVRHLHLEDIRRLPVPLPSYNEQTVFVEKIENIFNRISENEAVIDAELLRAETLRQSILKKAFSGQLVPQDPSDEPASKLLARIQAEKEFVNTQKTSKSNKRHSVSGH